MQENNGEIEIERSVVGRVIFGVGAAVFLVPGLVAVFVAVALFEKISEPWFNVISAAIGLTLLWIALGLVKAAFGGGPGLVIRSDGISVFAASMPRSHSFSYIENFYSVYIPFPTVEFELEHFGEDSTPGRSMMSVFRWSQRYQPKISSVFLKVGQAELVELLNRRLIAHKTEGRTD